MHLWGQKRQSISFNQGNADYLINFAQLTQRAGNFVVSREKEDSFKWEDLKGIKKSLVEDQVVAQKWYLNTF